MTSRRERGNEGTRGGRESGERRTHEFWSTFLPQTRHPLSSNIMLSARTSKRACVDVFTPQRRFSTLHASRFCALKRLPVHCGSFSSQQPNSNTVDEIEAPRRTFQSNQTHVQDNLFIFYSMRAMASTSPKITIGPQRGRVARWLDVRREHTEEVHVLLEMLTTFRRYFCCRSRW